MKNKKPSDVKAGESLRELQAYVWEMNKQRGFTLNDPLKKMLMLTEETGELAKALRKEAGMKSANSVTSNTAEEMADVLFVLLGLSSILGVDLYEAFLAKEIKNQKRVWQ